MNSNLTCKCIRWFILVFCLCGCGIYQRNC